MDTKVRSSKMDTGTTKSSQEGQPLTFTSSSAVHEPRTVSFKSVGVFPLLISIVYFICVLW